MIRSASFDDVPQITEIYNYYILNSVWSFEVEAVSEDEMRRRMQEVLETGPFLVFVDGEEVLGYAYAHPWKERPAYGRTFETTVYVKNGVCRRGIGSQLMEELVRRCRELPVHALIACITGSNLASIEMHKGLGFKQVSMFREVGMKFGQVLDVVDLELVI